MGTLSEIAVTFLHELRRSLRSTKTLGLLILYSLAASLSGLVFVAATRKLQESLSAAGANLPPLLLDEMKMGGLALLFGRDEALLRYLAQVPLIVLFFHKFALIFLPLLILVMGFDQISGELQAGSLRYSALRAGRGATLLGKLCAQAAVLFGLTAVVDAGLLVYAAATTSNFDLGAGVSAMVRFWLLTFVFASAYLALTAACSALFRTPILSLVTGLCALFGFWLLSVIGKVVDALAPLAYLSPSHYEDRLISPDLLTSLGSAGAYALFTLAFLGLAFLVLRERDL